MPRNPNPKPNVMKKQLIAGILLLFQFFFATLSFGQVSINQDGSPPHSSAMLDINAEDKGILIPRVQLSGAQIADPIVDPPLGLIVFNTGPNLPQGIYYWRGSSWTEFITGAEPFTGAAFAEIYEVNESGNVMTLSNSGYTPWNSAWQGAYDGDLVIDTINGTSSRIIINSAGNYQIDVSCSFAGDNNHTVNGSVFKNDEKFPRISFYQTLNSNDATSASASGIVTLQEGDYIDLRFKSSKNNKDISLQVANLRITKIGDPQIN